MCCKVGWEKAKAQGKHEVNAKLLAALEQALDDFKTLGACEDDAHCEHVNPECDGANRICAAIAEAKGEA